MSLPLVIRKDYNVSRRSEAIAQMVAVMMESIEKANYDYREDNS